MSAASEQLPESEVEPATTLLPLDEDGIFLVLGDLDALDGFETMPLPYLTPGDLNRVGDAITLATGATNVAVQVAHAANSASGLVRLAPETLDLLRAGATPLASGGWNLGTLTSGGKFIAHIRWAPAGAAGAAAALATIGPALALLAVQWQLTKIGRAVERNIALTRTVLDEMRSERWHELQAAADVVLQEAAKAQALGEVTDLLWDYLQSQSLLMVLQKHRAQHLDGLLRRRQDLLNSGDRSSDWFREHFTDLLRDGQGILVAQQGIVMLQLLRAAHARKTGRPEDEALAAETLRVTRQQHEDCAQLLASTLRDLHRSLSLWHEADPGKTLAVGNRKDVPLREVCGAVADLHERAVEGPFRHVRPLSKPGPAQPERVVDVALRDRPALESHLRWVLDDGETIHLLAHGAFRFDDDSEYRLLLVTSNRALLVNNSDLRNGRKGMRELPAGVTMELARRDGHEYIDLAKDGMSGSLRVKHEPDASVFQALTQLEERRSHDTGHMRGAAPAD